MKLEWNEKTTRIMEGVSVLVLSVWIPDLAPWLFIALGVKVVAGAVYKFSQQNPEVKDIAAGAIVKYLRNRLNP